MTDTKPQVDLERHHATIVLNQTQDRIARLHLPRDKNEWPGIEVISLRSGTPERKIIHLEVREIELILKCLKEYHT